MARNNIRKILIGGVVFVVVAGIIATIVGLLAKFRPELVPGFFPDMKWNATDATIAAPIATDALFATNTDVVDPDVSTANNNDARFLAKVEARSYDAGYDNASLVDCDACEWVYREKDDCCTSECNLESNVVINKPSPYECGLPGAAPGSKMYNCGPQMCQRGEMKGCTVDNLRRLKSTSSKDQPACSGYKKKPAKTGAPAQTCRSWDDSRKKCMDAGW
jgi:hypothetical protein